MEEFNTDLFASNQKSHCPHIQESYFIEVDGNGRLCEVESCFQFIKMLRLNSTDQAHNRLLPGGLFSISMSFVIYAVVPIGIVQRRDRL